LHNVSFSYKKDQPVLKKVSVKFPEGHVSALVGESGCGKSTIVQLLLRYYDVENGEVQVNAHNIKELNMNSFRRKVGFVGQ
jgi:ABC-type multidrug transport system fused ATPase/permease subunit